MLVPADPAWPLVELRHQAATVAPGSDRLTAGYALIRSLAPGHLRVERSPLAAVVVSGAVPDMGVVAHPLLARLAMVVAFWLGRPAFHGASVLASDGRAWMLLAPTQTGKTTLLQAVSARGYEVLADDLVVLDGAGVFAGPRLLSLRLDSADRLDPGLPRVTLGDEQRARLRLGAVPPQAQLGGWIMLLDAPGVSIRPIPPSERPAALGAFTASQPSGLSAPQLLELARLPAFRLGRPRTWSALESTVGALRSIVGDPPPH